LDAVEGAGLDAGAARVEAATAQLPVGEVGQVEEAVELLDVVVRGLVEQPLERRLVAGPAHAAQPIELATVQALDGAVGVGDLEVRVADGLNLGRLLGE